MILVFVTLSLASEAYVLFYVRMEGVVKQDSSCVYAYMPQGSCPGQLRMSA
jgi:hypothetical protein